MDKFIKNEGIIIIKRYLPSTDTGLSKVKNEELSVLRMDRDSTFFFENYTHPKWSSFMSTCSAGKIPERSNVLYCSCQ